MQIISGEAGFGFGPKNIVRIRQGIPAEPEAGPINELLSEEQIAILGGIALGKTAEEIVKDEKHNPNKRDVDSINYYGRVAWKRLGVEKSNRIMLAGYFPLDPDSQLLDDKSLDDLYNVHLKLLEGLSQGLNFEQCAVLGLKYSGRSQIGLIRDRWRGGANKTIIPVQIANGLRAKKVREAGITDPTDLLSEDFSLDILAKS